jgi:hypothetical protein
VRYYVLCRSEVLGILPFVVAEVVHEALELDDERATTLAATIAGADSTVATRDELMANADTRAALKDWEDKNDTEFDRETVIRNDAPDDEPPTPDNVIPLRRIVGPRGKRVSK